RRKRQLSIPEIEEYENREEKRRKSHSEMERERRRKTNLIIEELRDIIPGLKEQKNLHKLHIFEATLAFVKEHIKECTVSVRRAKEKGTTQCICIEQPECSIDESKELTDKPRYSSNILDKAALLINAPSSPSKSSIEFLTG
ncbi:hypothetical protein LPJ62_004203, partial [Coemansia sp. RSA 2167]